MCGRDYPSFHAAVHRRPTGRHIFTAFTRPARREPRQQRPAGASCRPEDSSGRIRPRGGSLIPILAGRAARPGPRVRGRRDDPVPRQLRPGPGRGVAARLGHARRRVRRAGRGAGTRLPRARARPARPWPLALGEGRRRPRGPRAPLVAEYLPAECSVIGWSLGGMVGVRLATLYPSASRASR